MLRKYYLNAISKQDFTRQIIASTSKEILFIFGCQKLLNRSKKWNAVSLLSCAISKARYLVHHKLSLLK